MQRMQAGPMLASGQARSRRRCAAAADEASGATMHSSPLRRSQRVTDPFSLWSAVCRPSRARKSRRRAVTGVSMLIPSRLISDAVYAGTLHDQSARSSPRGNVMLVTARPSRPADAARAVAVATGGLLRALTRRFGHTAGCRRRRYLQSCRFVARHLGIVLRRRWSPGAALSVHSDDARLDGLDIVLKGGQMGSPSFLKIEGRAANMSASAARTTICRSTRADCSRLNQRLTAAPGEYAALVARRLPAYIV